LRPGRSKRENGFSILVEEAISRFVEIVIPNW
jgi:hypothetical protein